MDEEWQTKMSNLKERGEMLFKTQELSDCEFVVGPQKTKISGHKLFLAISSPVFYAMFFGDMAEKKTVEIIDIEPDAFKGMLQYIYSDHVDFESCLHACEVFNAATKYMLPFLEQYCIKFLRGNVDASSACEVYEFAKFHDNSDMKDLKDVCIKIFRNSTQDVLKSTSFLEADYSTVLTILEQDMLEVDNELELFQGLKDWADFEAARTGVTVESLLPAVSDALCHIKFLSMSAEDFTGGPALSPLLTSEEKLAIAMNITKPGVVGIPDRLLKISTPRRPATPIVQSVHPAQWSLERVVSDSIFYPVTRWVNPFPKKGFSVSRSIKLKGVNVFSQRLQQNGDSPGVYREDLTLVLKKDWSVKFSGAKFTEETPYNSTFSVLLNRPVQLEPGKKYWIIIQFDKDGDYQFTRDANSTYDMFDNKIVLYEGFSPITEFLFCN